MRKTSIHRIIPIVGAALLISTAVACSSTDEIVVDMPRTQAYGLSPADFDKLRYPVDEVPSVDEPVTDPVADNNEETEATAETETITADETVPEETAPAEESVIIIDTDGDGIPDTPADMLTGSGNSSFLVTDIDGSGIDIGEGSVQLAGEESGIGTGSGDAADPLKEGSGYIAGEGETEAAGSDDNADGLTVSGKGWVIPEDSMPPEERPDNVPAAVIDEIRAYHDDVWAEKGPSTISRITRSVIPYVLAALAAALFVAIAVFAVRLSSGSIKSKSEKAREEYLAKKEQEAIDNAPIMSTEQRYSVFHKPSRQTNLKEEIQINGSVTVSRETMINNDLITFGDLIDTDTPPYPEEETLTELIRRNQSIA